MKHRITINTVVNNNCREVSIWTDDAKEILMFDKKITTRDNICMISLAKNMVILLTDSPQFRYSPNPDPNYVPNYDVNFINAYDYEGNHLWNIAEIIGNIGFDICTGHICSTDYLLEDSKKAYIDGHELFVCWDSRGMRYMIDLDDKKVIHKMMTR